MEVGAQSPDEQEHMDRDQPEPSQQPPVFDFEVKEQDRWLPIANGESSPSYFMPRPALFYLCLWADASFPAPHSVRSLPFVGFLPLITQGAAPL